MAKSIVNTQPVVLAPSTWMLLPKADPAAKQDEDLRRAVRCITGAKKIKRLGHRLTTWQLYERFSEETADEDLDCELWKYAVGSRAISFNEEFDELIDQHSMKKSWQYRNHYALALAWAITLTLEGE
jgi:hypothetical protein